MYLAWDSIWVSDLYLLCIYLFLFLFISGNLILFSDNLDPETKLHTQVQLFP